MALHSQRSSTVRSCPHHGIRRTALTDLSRNYGCQTTFAPRGTKQRRNTGVSPLRRAMKLRDFGRNDNSSEVMRQLLKTRGGCLGARKAAGRSGCEGQREACRLMRDKAVTLRRRHPTLPHDETVRRGWGTRVRGCRGSEDRGSRAAEGVALVRCATGGGLSGAGWGGWAWREARMCGRGRWRARGSRRWRPAR